MVHGYTAVPVLNDQEQYIGSVTEGDFLRHLLVCQTTDLKVQEGYRLGSIVRRNFCPALQIDSVSAFCNAGFDLLGVRTPFSSLTSYAANPVINLTIMFLIVFGGIGFLTWDDIRTNRLHLRKYRMQSKVILCTTAVLLIAPAMYFYFFEFDDLTRKERLLSSLFQAVTPRTAGFNTVDLTDLSEAGQFITIALMLIGGSPGSTAGGLKTTTIAVLLTTAISTFRRRENANLFGRRIDDDVVKNAATISLMYITLCCTGGLIISVSEGLPMLTCLFETASAVGTVGLSLGITPELNLLSRGILIRVTSGKDFILAHIDAKLIVQVIINLVDNAIKYTPVGSVIEIHTDQKEQWVTVSVSDNGPGIPDEQKPRIFDMFYSGANKVVDSRRSLGLGLSLCKSIVTAHGGTISVSDNQPNGTVFTFTLPAGEVELHE